MNIIIIDPTNSIKQEYKDTLRSYSTDYHKLVYMSDKIEDLKRNTSTNIQESVITPKTFLRYIKVHIIEKKHRTNIILYNVSIEDIHKYYYYMNYLEYNTVLLINNNDISKNEPELEQYDNIIITHDMFDNIDEFKTILSANPLYYNINENIKSNFVINGQSDYNYGKHRYGWNYVKQSIQSINKEGLFLDIFMEKTFLWDASHNTIYSDPWMGIFHNPVTMPSYFTKIFNIDDIFLNYSFIKSIESSKGLITLSNYNKELLQNKLPNTPIYVLKHPIPNTLTSFTMNDFIIDPKILHIGYWLRNYRTFYKLNAHKCRKLVLDKTKIETWLVDQLKELIDYQCHDVTDEEFNNVHKIDYLEDAEYDLYMRTSIVFVDLLDTSANNLVVECIKYNTPILINKHPAVVEYLGKDYPFYFDNIEEANNKCNDFELINNTHIYLKEMNKSDLNIVHFLKKLTKIHTKITDTVVNFNIGNQIKYHYGDHRSGWSYVVNAIQDRIKSSENSMYLDTFIERSFVWGGNAKTNVYTKEWAGILHNPRNIPNWFQSEQSLVKILKNKNFIISLMKCKMLITLSDYNTDFLENHPIIKKFNIPVKTLYHPTQIPDVRFDFDKFQQNDNKLILQIGWWLRKLHAIYLLPKIEGYKKVAIGLKDKTQQKMFQRERQYALNSKLIRFDPKSVELMDRVSDEVYDRLLSENIVFINLYDSSANNLVIECIARATPILINIKGGVVDYLGKDYPFYYDTYDEANEKLQNMDLIKETHEYLKRSDIQERIHFDTFYDGLCELFKANDDL